LQILISDLSRLTWAVWTAVVGYDYWIIAGNDTLCDGPGQHRSLTLIVDTRVNVGHPLRSTVIQLSPIHATCQPQTTSSPASVNMESYIHMLCIQGSIAWTTAHGIILRITIRPRAQPILTQIKI